MPRAGEDYSGYVLEETLGRGGSATVYLARRPTDTTPVALKVLDAEHRDEPDLVRLHREYDLAHRISHPHSVRVYELGPFWLAMQYVDGGNITRLSDPAQRMTALAQIAEALDHVHHLGIVHCDVKPANILIHRDFSRFGAVLIDYGVAHSLAQDMSIRLARDHTHRLTLDPARRISRQQDEPPAQVRASLPYAAPELLTGRMPSAATDEYGLACTAVELIAGRTPFTADTAAELVDAHLHRAAPRLSRRINWLSAGFDLVVAKGIAKDPEARYESCTDLVAALANALG